MINQAELKEMLHYNPSSGVFTWLKKRAGRGRQGYKAGRLHNGYVRINVLGRCYAAHRLAWLYINGDWPEDEVDHINGVKDDNKFDNLRSATRAENARNRGITAINTSGYKGVSQNKGKWQAQIKIDGKTRYLGRYETAYEAHLAYQEAATIYHKEYRRLSNG